MKLSVTRSLMLFVAAFSCANCVTILCAADPEKRSPVEFEDNFEKGADNWQPGNPAVWKIIDSPKGKAYSLFEMDPKFKTAHRSPFTYSLVKDIKLESFVFGLDAKSTV